MSYMLSVHITEMNVRNNLHKMDMKLPDTQRFVQDVKAETEAQLAYSKFHRIPSCSFPMCKICDKICVVSCFVLLSRDSQGRIVSCKWMTLDCMGQVKLSEFQSWWCISIIFILPNENTLRFEFHFRFENTTYILCDILLLIDGIKCHLPAYLFANLSSVLVEFPKKRR